MPDCKPFKLLFCLLCLSLALTGCGSSAGDNIKEAENSYKIYYVSSSEDKLVAEDYTAKEEETNKLINELLRQLNNVPDGTALKKPIPDSVDLKSKSLKDGVLTLDFSDTKEGFCSKDSLPDKGGQKGRVQGRESAPYVLRVKSCRSYVCG